MKVTLGQRLVEVGQIKKIILGLTILRNLKITLQEERESLK